MADEADRPPGKAPEGGPDGKRAERDPEGGPPVRPPSTIPDPGAEGRGPVPPRSEAVPPELPRAERAFVMAGPPGSVSERTDARPAGPPGGQAPPTDELAQRRARDETARLRARVEAIEQENRELWAMLIEERRERVREHDRMSRLVELARRNPPAPEGR
jgi:hypothetical protein